MILRLVLLESLKCGPHCSVPLGQKVFEKSNCVCENSAVAFFNL